MNRLRLPALVAHRGYTYRYPENTLVGLEAAVARGARYLEVDVQLSADKVPMLFHDRTLERVCGVPGRVHEMTAEQLRRLRAYEFDRFGYKFVNTPIALLSDVRHLLRAHPQVTAFIEVKRASLEQFGIPTVLEYIASELSPVAKQCVLISFAVDALLAARQYGGTKGWHALGAVVDRWRERRRADIRRLAPEYLFCDVEGLPRLGRLRIAGCRVVIYEVVDPVLALKLAARGVEFIETFAVAELHRSWELMQGAA